MKNILLFTVFTSISLATPAMADKHSKRHQKHIDFAKVIHVDPIYKTVQHKQPQRHCYYQDRVSHHKGSHTPIIIGSLIGGAIGNELGHNNSNKKVGAVAGAILGGSIAKDISQHRRQHHHSSRQICDTTYQVSYKEQISGYNVAYKYRGRTFHTRMKQHPGKRIKVAVSVQPLHRHDSRHSRYDH